MAREELFLCFVVNFISGEIKNTKVEVSNEADQTADISLFSSKAIVPKEPNESITFLSGKRFTDSIEFGF